MFSFISVVSSHGGLMGLFVRINSEGREIEPRRQLSFASERPSTRKTKNELETKNEKRRARERPLTRSRARSNGLDLKLLRGNEKDSIRRMWM